MPTAPFPHHYQVALEMDQLLAAPRFPISVGSASEFGGSDEVWSPEALLLGAALVCVKTTFDAFVHQTPVPVHGWFGRVTGTLERTLEGPVFTAIQIDLHITTAPGSEPRIRDLVHSVERSCIISRALKAPVTISADVVGRG